MVRRGTLWVRRPNRRMLLSRLPFLQNPLEFPALLFGEDLFDLGLAVTQYSTIVLPEIEFLAGRRVEGRLVQEVMHAEIHGHRSRRRAAQKHQREGDHASDFGIPRSGEARFLEQIRAHRWSSWPACFPAPRRYR